MCSGSWWWTGKSMGSQRVHRVAKSWTWLSNWTEWLIRGMDPQCLESQMGRSEGWGWWLDSWNHLEAYSLTCLVVDADYPLGPPLRLSISITTYGSSVCPGFPHNAKESDPLNGDSCFQRQLNPWSPDQNFFSLKKLFYWYIVVLQCFVNFFCVVKWLSYTYMHILYNILFHYGLS